MFVITFSIFSIGSLIKDYRKENGDKMTDCRKIFHKTAFDITLALSENVAGGALLA